jgi:hypothetical protein
MGKRTFLEIKMGIFVDSEKGLLKAEKLFG